MWRLYHKKNTKYYIFYILGTEMESLQGQCHFEEINEEDFLDALTTLNLFDGTYRCTLVST